MDKKKLLALLIFLIMGFFMATFANPSDEQLRLNQNANPITNENNKANTADSTTENTSSENTSSNSSADTQTTKHTTNTTGGSTTKTTSDNSENAIGNVEKDKYLVRFIDFHKSVLKAEEVYEGEDASSEGINVQDYTLNNVTYTFAKWDKPYTNVVKNIDVNALYVVKEIFATVSINGKEADQKVELLVNKDTEKLKDVILTKNNLEKYIKNIDELPTPDDGMQQEVGKLVYDKDNGYILEVSQSLIDYDITAREGALISADNENFKTKMTANINDTIYLSHESRKGYNFQYYIISNGEKNIRINDDSIVVNTSNLDIVAVYQLIDYSIEYELDGGSFGKDENGNVISNPDSYNVETTTFTLNNPSKVGFTFLGWAESGQEDLSKTVTIVKGSTIGNKKYTAKFEANNDTKYTVEVYLEKLYYDSDVPEFGDTPYVIYSLEGTSESQIMVTADDITGFEVTGDKQRGVTIAADGSTVVRLEYLRKEYTVTFKMHDVNDNVVYENVKYGRSVDIPKEVASYTENNATYEFTGYDDEATKNKDKYIVLGNKDINALYKITKIKADVLLDNQKIGTADIYVNPTTRNAFKENTTKKYNKYNIDKATYERDDNYSYSIDSLEYVQDQGFKVNVKRSLKKHYVYAGSHTKVNNTTRVYEQIGTPITLSHDEILGYTFDSYYVDNGLSSKKIEGDNKDQYIVENMDVIIFSVYTQDVYNVTFKWHGGSKVENTTYGKGVIAPNKRTIPSYSEDGEYCVFNGKWDKQYNYITKDTEINAVYDCSAIEYKISYNLNGGNLDKANPTVYKKTDGEIKLNEPYIAGYTFDGWFDKQGNKYEKLVPTIRENLELTAKFTARNDIEYKINVCEEIANSDKYNCEVFDTKTGTTNDIATEDAPDAKDGFELKVDDELLEGNKKQTKITADGKAHIDFYYNRLKYNVTYKVTFVTKDGRETKEVHQDEVAYGDTIPTFTYNYNHDEYSLSDWKVEPNGVRTTMPNSNVEYTATATKKTFKVRWLVGTSKKYDEDVEYGNTTSYVGETPRFSKTEVGYTYNYEFTGWDKDPSKTPITRDTDFNAKFITLFAREATNAQLSYTQYDNTVNIKNDLVVEIRDEKDNTVRTLSASEYSVDGFKTSSIGHKQLTITASYNGKNLTNKKLYYDITEEEAYNTKFEIILNIDNKYEQTKYPLVCERNCDKKVDTITTDYNFIEVIEHYNQYIEVKDVKVTYANGQTIGLDVSDEIRYTHRKHGDDYNPVYLARKKGYNMKDSYTLEYAGWVWGLQYIENGTYRYSTTRGTYVDSSHVCRTVTCDYYNLVPFKEPYDKNTTYYKKDGDSLKKYTPSGYVDVQTDDNSIKLVTVKYHRDRNDIDHEEEGVFELTFRYENGNFKCISEKKVG